MQYKIVSVLSRTMSSKIIVLLVLLTREDRSNVFTFIINVLLFNSNC